MLIVLVSWLVGQVPKLAPQFKQAFDIATSTFQYGNGTSTINGTSSNTELRQGGSN